MKAVVTGGAGFIGSHIAEALLDEAEVHVVDDLSLGDEGNLPKGVTFHRASVLDLPRLRDAFAGARWVFHQAALPSVPRSVEDPVRTHQANVDGTMNVLLAAREAGVEKVVFAASSSAYGDTPTLPKHEGMVPNPRSPYAASKLAGEMYCRAFHASYGLRTTCLRYFNVYGPRQSPEGAYAAVIPRFLRASLRGEPLTLFGDGTQSRDFTYVADAVQANLLAARSTKSDGLVVNVGAGRRTSLLELAREVNDLTGSRSPITHAPPRAGDVAHSLADLTLARETLGYEPKVDVRQGLAATLAWWRAQGPGLNAP